MVSAAARGRAGNPADGPRAMSIGAVLELLRQDFPDISISKIRYLEDQGLVEPLRTAAGYRKFTPEHVDRLRYVLGVQRDHYMPLRVIREHLDALDQGLEPPVAPARTGPRLVEAVPDRFSRGELLALAGIDDEVLADLESHGLVSARLSGQFDAEAVAIARAAAELAAFGLQPRHLRAFRAAADREAGLIEQVTSSQRHSEDVTHELSTLCVQLHSALLKAALERGQS
jgi:DNA-binding transcriptional MerR regulator